MRNETFSTSFWLLLFLMFLIVGCSPVEQPTTILDSPTIEFSVSPTQFESDTPVPILPPTSTPEPTLTLIPTLSPTQLPTSTLTPTITPTPLPIGIVSVEAVNFRTGPGEVYPIAFAIALETEMMILGQSEDGLWYYAEVEDGQQGWVLVDLIIVNNPNLELAIVESPPTPILPSATPGDVPIFFIGDSYRGPGYFRIELKHFPPGDSCRLDVFNPEGKKVYTHLYNLDETGNRTHTPGENIIKGLDTYTFIIQCESGFSAQTTYSKK